jgi:hydroxymethylpyrimidine pyrophosphatase-like HAD family hydrolase
MIRLFVLDIDGCISYPFKSPDWDNMGKIRHLNELSRNDNTIPALSICSGRPHPYVEAVSQWLDIDHPVVFESGGGFYRVKTNELQWHPVVTEDVFKKNELLKDWIESEIIPKYPGMIREFSKITDVGLVSSSEADILSAHEKIRQYVNVNFPDYEVHHTEVSVNIIVRNCNKGEGLRHLSGMTGIALEQIAYIGDSSGDVTALKTASRAFAPSNASGGVKEIARVLQGETSNAILAAYEILIAENRLGS